MTIIPLLKTIWFMFKISLFLFSLLIICFGCFSPLDKNVKSQKFSTIGIKKNNFHEMEIIKMLMVDRLYKLISNSNKKYENYEILIGLQDITLNYNLPSKTLFYKNFRKKIDCDTYFDYVYTEVEIAKLLEASKRKLDSTAVYNASLKEVLDSMFTSPVLEDANLLRGKYLNTNLCNSSKVKDITR